MTHTGAMARFIRRAASSRPATILGVALSYAAVAKVVSLTTTLPGNISPIFPSAGLALASVLILGRPALFGVWLGSFLANTLLYFHGMGSSFAVIARDLLIPSIVGVGAMSSAGVGALLVRWLCKGQHPLYTARTVLTLVTVGALGCCMLSPSVGVLTLALTGAVPWKLFGYSWLTWWLGDAAGTIIAAPLVLAWHHEPRFRYESWRSLEAMLLGAVTSLLCFFAFFRNVPFEYGLMPLLLWAAFRYGMRGASTVAAAIAIFATVGTARGLSPFVKETVNESLLLLHSFLGVTIGCALFLAGVLAERKRAEEKLKESEARYRIIVENAPIAIFRRQLEGGYQYINPGLVRQFECKTEEEFLENYGLISQRWAYPERHDEFKALLLKDRGVYGYEVASRLVSGATKWFAIYAFMDASGAFINGFSLDITERKRAEADREKLQAELLQAQKMESVGRLAGGVAHDFNNMLQVILGSASLALTDIPPESTWREHLEVIRKSALSSADLTRQLLAFARKQTIQPRVLELNDTVAGMLKMLRRLIGEDLTLAWMPGADLWLVKVDPSQIDQILANLCVNARDAIAGAGKVTIETANVAIDDTHVADLSDVVAGDYVMLAVSDTGHGIDAKTRSHLFEPFFTTKALGKGTGLGLATVFGIVKQNRGLIDVSSEPGRGTTFKIYLPREKIASATMAENPQPFPNRASGTVLLVEDEAAILSLGRRVLMEQGYTVLAALTPMEALTLAEKHHGTIDLLVTDVVMPGMNGKALQESLRNRRPHLKCLFISGYTSDVVAHQGVLDEGVHFLQKPFTMESLTQRVGELLVQGEAPPSRA